MNPPIEPESGTRDQSGTQTSVTPQPLPTISRPEADALRALARLWRATHADRPEHTSGYIVVCDNETCGWIDSRNQPGRWQPGCFRVPSDENMPICVATGGSVLMGATDWTETEIR